MPKIVGENPGGPELWGRAFRIGPFLDVFVGTELTGTSERLDRAFAAFVHMPGSSPDAERVNNFLLGYNQEVSAEFAGLVGLVRVLRGTTSRPKATLEAWAGERHASIVIPPTLPFDIRSVEESKEAVRRVIASPPARLLAGAVITGAAATAAFKKLSANRAQQGSKDA